ncbi:copper-binding protein [Hydrogenophaga sp.]|uniref:copper-binding protein n=1 Tax=Hydrogenophaga sp. TaxID=1904254 RepID=UPI002722AAB8|nr:copper-binding protein [Hydrogenophaga sp.]MDO9437619.1 copper-binding protein [Hydrogenophaga sp.]
MQRKHLLIAAIGLSLATAVASFANAQPAQPAHDAQHHAPTETRADAITLPTTDAEVRRVDTANGKITLKHGEIKNLDMPPMTMVFQAREPGLLANIKAGDKVRVTLDKVNGVFMLMSIEPAR